MAKLGIMIEGQMGVTWDHWTRLIDKAETLGFESLWRSDHLLALAGATNSEVLPFWPSLTVVALRSKRIRFGQLVSPFSFRGPEEMARNALALDHLSGGRYVLGVGAGWNEREHDAFGIPFRTVGERMDRLEDGVECVKRLWTGEPVSFEGKQFRLDQAQMRPTPLRPDSLKLLVAGSGEKRLLRIAAKYADEWNTVGAPGETYRAKRDALEEHCRKAGRDASTIERSWMGGYLVYRDEEQMRQRAARQKERMPRGLDAPVEEVPELLRQRGWLVGTPAEIVAQIKEREADGLTGFMLQTLDIEDLSPLDDLARDVLPRV